MATGKKPSRSTPSGSRRGRGLAPPGRGRGPGDQFPDGIGVIKKPVMGQRDPIELPQRYYDFNFIMAHFPAPIWGVRKLLPDDDTLVPVEIVPGLAIVSLAGFEYRQMKTLQPYNEVAVMVPVRHQPETRIPLLPLLWPDEFEVAFWVYHLPVTTQEACAAGLTIWNLPKVVAKITFEDVGWMRHCTLEEDGQHVLTLRSRIDETQFDERAFYALSIQKGKLLRSLVDTQAEYHAWFTPGGASFELGTHPVARRLRSVGIWNIAVAGLYASSARSRLHEGVALPRRPPPRRGRSGR
jgi:hypothetical protein